MKDHYTFCEILFCDIDNIHGVRDAINKVYDMAYQQAAVNNPSKWLTSLDNSGLL